MSLVSFTQGAEQAVLDILGDVKQLDETLIIVDVSGERVHVRFEDIGTLKQLQRDVELVGPFRTRIAGEETTFFVRDHRPTQDCFYELDYCVSGNRRGFLVRLQPKDVRALGREPMVLDDQTRS